MSDKQSRVGLRTISSTQTRQNNVPTASIFLNPYNLPKKPWIIIIMVKATLVYFIDYNCGNIQSTPSLDPYLHPHSCPLSRLNMPFYGKSSLPIVANITTYQNNMTLSWIYIYPIYLYNFILFIPFYQVQNYVWRLISKP